MAFPAGGAGEEAEGEDRCRAEEATETVCSLTRAIPMGRGQAGKEGGKKKKRGKIEIHSGYDPQGQGWKKEREKTNTGKESKGQGIEATRR